MAEAARPLLPGFLLALSAACGTKPAAQPPIDLVALPHVLFATGPEPGIESPVNLQGERRPCLVAPTPSEMRFRLRIPPRPLLTFAIGIKSIGPTGGEKPRPALDARAGRMGSPRAAKLRFSIRAGVDRPAAEIFRREIHLGRSDEWLEQAVDLRRYAGREIWLSFERALVGLDGAPLEIPSKVPALAALFAEPILHDRAAYGLGRAVVLISIDTLRRDHLSLYHYRRRTTPALEALGAEAVVFEDAVSTSSWTLPAHGSLLTSLYPSAHGAVNLRRSLPEGLLSLADLLQTNGFFSQAMVTHLYLSAPYGFGRGFDRHLFLSEARAEEVTDRALAFLRARGDRDFFLFLHYYDPHWHYDPPPPYDRTFDPGYRGKASGIWWDFKSETRESLAPGDLNHIVALYDGEILYTDRQLGRLFRGMKQLGIFDKTLVVVTSDHGEEFLDHGSWEHQKTLYEEQLRIPLVIKLTGGEGRGRRVARQVSLVDVAPTLVDALGLPVPASFQGRSLLPFLRNGSAAFPAAVWAETEHTVDGSHKIALRQGAAGLKWIVSLRPSEEPFVEFYDLARDPSESGHSPRSGRAEEKQFLSRVEAFLAEAGRRRLSLPAPSPVDLPPEQLEKLRALGYVR